MCKEIESFRQLTKISMNVVDLNKGPDFANAVSKMLM